MTPAGAARRPARLHVALLTDFFLPRRGGIELHLADLARRLATAGHQVDVLTTTPAPPPGDPHAAHDAALDGACDRPCNGACGVRVLRLDVPRIGGVGCTPALLRVVGAALDAGAADGRPYDVAHAHASVISPMAWAAMHEAGRRGLPRVLTAHSVLTTSAHAFGVIDALTGWARDPVLVTGVSAVVTDGLRAGLPRARVSVLPNATDVAWWRAPAADGVRLLDAAGVPPRAPGEVRLVTAMRFARKKRPLALVDVLAAAIAAAPPGVLVRLVAAGDGPLRAALARAARARGLADALILPGWLARPALRTLYHDADAFVLPTEHESFGIAALEARAAGVPVLGRAGTGLAEFVDPHGAAPDGVLAPDDGALAMAAARLVADGAWRSALHRASAGRPPCDHDWTAVVARHEAAYAAAGARGA